MTAEQLAKLARQAEQARRRLEEMQRRQQQAQAGRTMLLEINRVYTHRAPRLALAAQHAANKRLQQRQEQRRPDLAAALTTRVQRHAPERRPAERAAQRPRERSSRRAVRSPTRGDPSEPDPPLGGCRQMRRWLPLTSHPLRRSTSRQMRRWEWSPGSETSGVHWTSRPQGIPPPRSGRRPGRPSAGPCRGLHLRRSSP
jgi:hypothetical protein